MRPVPMIATMASHFRVGEGNAMGRFIEFRVCAVTT
jgi:hypothetical protein